MAEGALRNTATRWAWPTSRLSGRVTARRGTSNGSSKAISGRLEHLRASALGSRILTKHIARRLPTSEGQGPTTPLIGMSRLTAPSGVLLGRRGTGCLRLVAVGDVVELVTRCVGSSSHGSALRIDFIGFVRRAVSTLGFVDQI